MEVSFTVLRNLQCPLRYTLYLNNSVKLNKYVSSLIGVKVHNIYSSHIKEGRRYFNKSKFPSFLRRHLHSSFLAYIHDHKFMGYEIFSEQNFKLDISRFDILNIKYLYVKPDVVLISKDKIKIFELKTGRIRNNFYQLVIYSWIVSNLYPSRRRIEGYSYSTLYNTSDLQLNATVEDVHGFVEYEFNLLSDFLSRNKIKFLQEIPARYNSFDSLNLTDCHSCFYKQQCDLKLQSLPTFPWSDKVVEFRSYVQKKSEKKTLVMTA